MNNRIAKWATAAGAVAILTLSSGCATIQDVDALEGEVGSLRAELAAAQEAAASARAEAEAARAAAGDAASAAGDAMSAANDAQASGAANAEKIDRMLEKVMMKVILADCNRSIGEFAPAGRKHRRSARHRDRNSVCGGERFLDPLPV